MGKLRGRPVKYPWSKWLRSGARKLEKGTHFDCEPASLAISLRRYIRQKGLVGIVRVRDLSVLITIA